jgi:hypothetical protein
MFVVAENATFVDGVISSIGDSRAVVVERIVPDPVLVVWRANRFDFPAAGASRYVPQPDVESAEGTEGLLGVRGVIFSTCVAAIGLVNQQALRIGIFRVVPPGFLGDEGGDVRHSGVFSAEQHADGVGLAPRAIGTAEGIGA